MGQALRFAIVLILGLGFITWGASVVVDRTTQGWFEKDISLRARLAVSGARRALIAHWLEDPPENLRELLSEVTHDERILAAAACDADLTFLARTKYFPEQLTCSEIEAHVHARGDTPSEQVAWRSLELLPGGNVHVSAMPVADRDRTLGFVVLVHDLSFVQRRAATMRLFLLITFGFLALAAAAVTLVAARLARRGWSDDLRSGLRSGSARAEFQPILRDVRELVDRIVAERQSDREGGAWNPGRLKQTLNRYLHGEKMVLLANREPYVHEKPRYGEGISVLHPASGLVAALEPIMRACSGTWIAHGNGSADRETADRQGRVRVPPGEESYLIRRVWLTPEQEKGYYYGFANEGLWPLCHIAHTRPTFRSDDWRQYQEVNQKFADALLEEVDSEDPIVLVQDYHFALAPSLIHQRLPRATIIMFWHIPWPNSQRFGICPWPKELLDGMLGASILGFQTQSDCNSFVDCADRFLEARIDREQGSVVRYGKSTLVRPYPISLDWPCQWASHAPPVEQCRAAVFRELGLQPDALLGVAVDRLDYTKGVEERLLAVERLLERFPIFSGRFTFVQLAAPSRTAIGRYRQLNESVEQLVARINGRFGQDGYRPVVLLRSHHEPPTVFQYYRAADVCYVASLHDGMNLVAKEFVAAREDEGGVLVLSQFTGAARELTEALIVNPYDIEEASSALATALSMSEDEKRDRMHSMRTFVSEFNVYRWAGRMLVDAARLRTRDRLNGRLTDHGDASANVIAPPC